MAIRRFPCREYFRRRCGRGCGAYLVEAGDAGCTWIDGEHVVFLVEDDFEDVGVAADEDVGQMGVDELEGLVVVPAGVAADVHHQHSLSPALEKLCVRDSAADLRAVAVAVDSFERLEIRNLQQGLRFFQFIGGFGSFLCFLLP